MSLQDDIYDVQEALKRRPGLREAFENIYRALCALENDQVRRALILNNPAEAQRQDILQLIEAIRSYDRIKENFRGKDTYVRALGHYGRAVVEIQQRIGIEIIHPEEVSAAVIVAGMDV